MTLAHAAGVVRTPTSPAGSSREQPNDLGARYRRLIGDRLILLSFQTVMELRFGALRRQWGELRRAWLELRLADLDVVQPNDEMVTACAELRQRCEAIGHPLGNKVHDGDRWVAATAVRLGVPVVSHDRVFDGVPGLELLTELDR